MTASYIAQWNTAAGWGNHANAGYLTSESDPQFSDGSLVGIATTAPNHPFQIGGGGTAALDQAQTSYDIGSLGTNIWQSFTADATGALAWIEVGCR